MSWKSNVTAAFAAGLVAAVIGCDSDAASPDPDPISVAGVYNYTFDFTNGEEGEISCEGEGGITITQQPDSTFSGETADGGLVNCSGSELPISVPSGVVAVTGEISDTDLTLRFHHLGDELCDASGMVEGNPVTGISGTATCLVDPAVLGLSGDPVELTGSWRGDRTGG